MLHAQLDGAALNGRCERNLQLVVNIFATRLRRGAARSLAASARSELRKQVRKPTGRFAASPAAEPLAEQLTEIDLFIAGRSLRAPAAAATAWRSAGPHRLEGAAIAVVKLPLAGIVQ